MAKYPIKFDEFGRYDYDFSAFNDSQLILFESDTKRDLVIFSPTDKIYPDVVNSLKKVRGEIAKREML